ncbi:hypothetical protein TNCV_3722001 [Trichonephila clavipes]|nr:hypothetical protein TNCV_3722001 [Trichonephila clavipes]
MIKQYHTDVYLEQETIRDMQWQAPTPDFNPIEQDLDDLGTQPFFRPRHMYLATISCVPQYRINILRTAGRYKGQKEQTFKRRLWPVYRPRNAFPS